MKKEYMMSIIFIVSIILGSVIGLIIPSVSEFMSSYTDYMLLILIFLIFLETPFENMFQSIKNYTVLGVILATNFMLIPIIGFIISSAFFRGNELVMLGLLIYFMAPCTDWFLGFTRVAKGNTSLGSILIPINMIIQVALYPVYLFIFMRRSVEVSFVDMFSTLIDWFFIPFVLAVVLHFIALKVLNEKWQEKSAQYIGNVINVVLVAIVGSLFAVNISTIVKTFSIFPLLLLSVFVFFVVVYYVVEIIARVMKLSYKDFALFSMTTSARNAPLMLGITATVFPNEPLMYSALIIGMLIEFPHLSVLSGILLRRKKRG